MAELDAGEAPCCRSRWADLPADLLAAVFQHVLRPPSGIVAGTPLRPLLHQLLALSRICRHWAAVAAKFPVDLELYAASPAGRAWLARRPLRRLRLASSPAEAVEEAAEAALLGLPPASADDRRGPTMENTQQDVGPLPTISEALAAAAAAQGGAELPLHDFRAARSVGWRGEAEGLFPWVAAAAGHSLTFDGMLQELDGVADWSTLQAPRPKTWALSSWPSLEELSLEGPVNWHGDFSTFDTAALAGLTRLTTLRLSDFYGYNLGGLPPSLRRLRLHFQPCLPPELAKLGLEFSLSMLRLPEHASLDELVVVKHQGYVAFSWPGVSCRCRRLVLHSGLRDSKHRGAFLAGVPLSRGDDPGGRHVQLFNTTRVSPEQQAAAQAAALDAWLNDFARGSAIPGIADAPCRLAELCCALPGGFWSDVDAAGAARRRAWRDAPLLLLPVAEEGAEPGGVEEQLRRYHASLAHALLDEALFPALPAELPTRWFFTCPTGLEQVELSSSDRVQGGHLMVALRSRAKPSAAAATTAAAAAQNCMAYLAL